MREVIMRQRCSHASNVVEGVEKRKKKKRRDTEAVAVRDHNSASSIIRNYRKFIRNLRQPLSIISACSRSSTDIHCPHRFIRYLARRPRVGLITLKRRVRKSIRP